MHKWTQEERQFIREYVLSHTWRETAEEFNRKFGCSITLGALRGAGKRYGIRSGRTGQFVKGQIPANKGKKMDPEKYKKCMPTMFYKGNQPPNHKPVGTLSIRSNNKRNQRYVYEKVAEPNVWRLRHILEWERYNGPVPEGKIIIFADGNSLNTDISNLVMISRSQHAVMNRLGIHGCNKDQTEMAANVASLRIQISKRKRGKKNGGNKNVKS